MFMQELLDSEHCFEVKNKFH